MQAEKSQHSDFFRRYIDTKMSEVVANNPHLKSVEHLSNHISKPTVEAAVEGAALDAYHESNLTDRLNVNYTVNPNSNLNPLMQNQTTHLNVIVGGVQDTECIFACFGDNSGAVNVMESELSRLQGTYVEGSGINPAVTNSVAFPITSQLGIEQVVIIGSTFNPAGDMPASTGINEYYTQVMIQAAFQQGLTIEANRYLFQQPTLGLKRIYQAMTLLGGKTPEIIMSMVVQAIIAPYAIVNQQDATMVPTSFPNNSISPNGDPYLVCQANGSVVPYSTLSETTIGQATGGLTYLAITTALQIVDQQNIHAKTSSLMTGFMKTIIFTTASAYLTLQNDPVFVWSQTGIPGRSTNFNTQYIDISYGENGQGFRRQQTNKFMKELPESIFGPGVVIFVMPDVVAAKAGIASYVQNGNSYDIQTTSMLVSGANYTFLKVNQTYGGLVFCTETDELTPYPVNLPLLVTERTNTFIHRKMQGDKIGKQSASVVTTITFGSVRFTQGGACAIGSLSTGNISPQDPNMIKYVTDPSVVIPAKPIAL